MFVVLLTYCKPLEEIDALMAPHVQWLEAQYARGLFLASGRRVPRTGAVILTRDCERSMLEEILAQDPFSIAGAVKHEVVEFTPGMSDPGFAACLQAT